jgi:hypothetical protein
MSVYFVPKGTVVGEKSPSNSTNTSANVVESIDEFYIKLKLAAAVAEYFKYHKALSENDKDKFAALYKEASKIRSKWWKRGETVHDLTNADMHDTYQAGQTLGTSWYVKKMSVDSIKQVESPPHIYKIKKDHTPSESTATLAGEVWKSITKFMDGTFKDFYEVSNLGRVRAIAVDKKVTMGLLYQIKPKILKQRVANPSSKQMIVTFNRNGIAKHPSVCKLVTDEFTVIDHTGKFVKFADGNFKNCNLSNLIWVNTVKEAKASKKAVKETSQKAVEVNEGEFLSAKELQGMSVDNTVERLKMIPQEYLLKAFGVRDRFLQYIMQTSQEMDLEISGVVRMVIAQHMHSHCQ